MSSHLTRRLHAGAFGRDLRLAARRFAREPGLAVAAILTLAVGIGACTSMFSIVQAVVLQPFDVADPERVVVMWPQFDDTAGEFAYNTYRDIQRQTTAFGQIAVTGSTNWPATVLLEGGYAAQSDRVRSLRGILRSAWRQGAHRPNVAPRRRPRRRERCRGVERRLLGEGVRRRSRCGRSDPDCPRAVGGRVLRDRRRDATGILLSERR